MLTLIALVWVCAGAVVLFIADHGDRSYGKVSSMSSRGTRKWVSDVKLLGLILVWPITLWCVWRVRRFR